MRPWTISEIENSFLMLFTPAILVAGIYFLFNLLAWPLGYLRNKLMNYFMRDDEFFRFILHSVDYIMVFSILVVVFFFIFVPKLKTKNVESLKHPFSYRWGFILLSCIIFIGIGIYYSIYFIAKCLNQNVLSRFLYEIQFNRFFDPLFFVIFFLYSLVFTPLFTEFTFRRTIIPLCEDRGLSPLHSVILAAFGTAMIDIPTYILLALAETNLLQLLLQFGRDILIAFVVGNLYILTRKIIFPIIFQSVINLYMIFGQFGYYYNNSSFQIIFDFIGILSILGIFFLILLFLSYKVRTHFPINEWLKILKKPSSQYIIKGVIGFFGISLFLLLIQTGVVYIGRHLTRTWYTYPEYWTRYFPDYFNYIIIFYIISFVVIFLFSVSTEYAQDS